MAQRSVCWFERQQRTDAESSARTRPRVQRAADHADPLPHPDQAVPAAVGAAVLVQLVRGALAVVLDEQAETVVEVDQAHAGARVGVLEIDPERIEQTVGMIEQGGGEALALPTDVMDTDAVRASVARAAEHFGGIDILVNNAGGVSCIEGLRAAPMYAVYAACKAGMISFTKSTALEPAEHDGVNAYVPLGREGNAEEFAKAAVFLCSDDAAYVTGATLNIDGGTFAASGWIKAADGDWSLFGSDVAMRTIGRVRH